MTAQRRFHHLFFLSMIAVFTASGCAGIRMHTEPPYVSLVNMNILQIGIFEQRFLLQLRIQNPNDFALSISGMKYKLMINEKDFARGVNRHSVTLPAYGEEIVDVEVVSDLGSLLNQIRELGTGQIQTLSYRLSGSASLANSLIKLPFDYQGEVDLSFEEPARIQ
jgi:LEA14-like dessication related protein